MNSPGFGGDFHHSSRDVRFLYGGHQSAHFGAVLNQFRAALAVAQPYIVLVAIGIYDNSDANPDNPDSNQTVWFGLQSEEEMFIGFFEAIWNAPRPHNN